MSRKGQAVSAVAQLPSGARVLITHEMQPFPLSYCPYCPLIIIALYQTITVFRVHCSESNSASVSSLAGLPTPTPVLIRASTDFTFFSICFPKLFPPLFSLSASTSTHDTQRHRTSRSWSYTALEERRRWGLLPQLHHFALCNLSLGYHVTPHAGGSERYVSAAHALKCYNVYTRVNNHRNSLLMPLLLNLLPFPVYASTCVCCSMRARSEGSWSTMSTNYRFSQNFPGVEKHDHNNTR